MAFTSPFGLLPSMSKSKGISLACIYNVDTDPFSAFTEKLCIIFLQKIFPGGRNNVEACCIRYVESDNAPP